MENIAMLILVGAAAFCGTLALFTLLAQSTTSEIEKIVQKLPPPPPDIADIDYEPLILSNMTKYRVISRVLCIDGEALTYYFPQRKKLLRWKYINQNGETVKFLNIFEAFRYVAADPLAVNVEQPPVKLNDQLTCWVYHFTARTTEEDLHEFLKSVMEDVSVWKEHELMIISTAVSNDFRIYLPVRPGDSVVLYPDGQVYVVPNLDLFPDSALSTK